MKREEEFNLLTLILTVLRLTTAHARARARLGGDVAPTLTRAPDGV